MKDFNTIPTIDLQDLLDSAGSGIQGIAKQIKEKLEPIGFAYLVNHSISQNLINAVFMEAKRFNNLPLEAKMKIKQNNCFRGYMPQKASQLKVSTEGKASKPNQLESFVMTFEVDESHPDYSDGHYLAGPNQWPENLPNFKETLCEYRNVMLQLSHQLLKVFAVAFGLKPDGLNEFFVNPSYFLRLQY